MTKLKITTEGEAEVLTFLGQLPDTIFKNAKTIFRKSALNIENQIKENATTKLMVRTGALKRSIGSEVFGSSLKELGFSVYSASKVGGESIVYAPIQEEGGTIVAKNAYKNVPGGPYLNIPATANKTAAGVMRMGAREVFNQGGYIAGKVVYLSGEPMFWLVKQVKIKPQLGMQDAADDEIPTLLSNLNNMSLEA